MFQGFKNYTNYTIHNNKFFNIITTVLNKLGFFVNETTIIRDCKKLRFYSNIINNKNIYNLLRLNNTFFINKNYQLPVSFQNQYVWLLHRSFLSKHNFLINLSIYNTIKIARAKFMIVSPNLINNYINYQLQKPKQFKSKLWQKSYYLALVEITRFFLARFKHNIIGIKIICSGK